MYTNTVTDPSVIDPPIAINQMANDVCQACITGSHEKCQVLEPIASDYFRGCLCPECSDALNQVTSAILLGNPVEAPQKYRKKPVEVEALRYTGENAGAIYDWSEGQVRTITIQSPHDPEHLEDALMLESSEGFLLVKVGDWVIKGENGSFQSCDSFVFDLNYDQ